MKSYRYTAVHLPSGKTIDRTAYVETEDDFLRELANWNRQGGKRWMYYPDVYFAPKAPVITEDFKE